MIVKLLTEHHLEFLSLKGDCTGSSGSTLVKMTHFWKSHVTAHMYHILMVYQSPLILTELFQHNLINVSYLTACYLYQVMMRLHSFNDVANDAESTQNQKICHNRCFEEWSTMGKLINKIPGSRLLISSLPGSALRTHVESLGKPRDVNKRSRSLAW